MRRRVVVFGALAALALAALASCAPTTFPEPPISPDDRVAHIAVDAASLIAYARHLDSRREAPAQPQRIKVSFRPACVEGGGLTFRVPPLSGLEARFQGPGAPAWIIDTAALAERHSVPPFERLVFDGVIHTGYKAIALTSADRARARYPALAPPQHFDMAGRRSVSLGAYRVVFDAETGAARLAAAEGGPALEGAPAPLSGGPVDCG